MRKRNDSCRSEQEDINLRNFIYDTNQSLQNLKNSITDVTLKHDRLLAKLESMIKNIEIAFENFSQRIEKTVSDNNQRIGSISSSLDHLKDDVNDKFLGIDSTYVTQDHYFKDASSIKEDIGHVTKDAIEKNAYFNNELMLLRGLLDHKCEELKKDLTPVIPEVDPIKKDIDAHLDIFRNEFRGILKEMRVLKQSKEYSDKKFENIYTLIERLKEAKK